MPRLHQTLLAILLTATCNAAAAGQPDLPVQVVYGYAVAPAFVPRERVQHPDAPEPTEPAVTVVRGGAGPVLTNAPPSPGSVVDVALALASLCRAAPLQPGLPGLPGIPARF